MKKLLCLLLALVMVFSLAACGGKTEPPDPTKTPEQTAAPAGETTPAPDENGGEEVKLEPYKIAVAFTQINATALAQQEYLKTYVAPAFNVEFMFSEAVDSAEVAMTFIENAYAAGCQAIMNFQNSSVEQINAKANELGMYIISNAPPAENDDLPYVVGSMRIPVSGVAAAFKEMVKHFTADGNAHNVVIISAGAGLGNAQHYESTVSILEALQEAYGLTYADEIENLASSRGMVEVETGTDMKILIYPGYPNADTYVSGLSAELQTGIYDIVLGCNQATAKFAVAIDEVERAYNTDIKVGYVSSSVDEATIATVKTLDVNGNPSVDSVIVNPGNVLVGGMFAVLHNALSGYKDAMRTDGKGTVFYIPLWLAPDAETYLKLTELNSDADKLEMSMEDIQSILCVYHPDVTAQSLQETIETLTADSVLAARGME